MLGVDDVKFSSPYEKVCECNFVVDFIIVVPVNNRRRDKVPVDKVVDEPYGILIIESP